MNLYIFVNASIGHELPKEVEKHRKKYNICVRPVEVRIFICLIQDGLYGRKEGLEPRKDRLYNRQEGLLPVESFTPSQFSYAFDF